MKSRRRKNYAENKTFHLAESLELNHEYKEKMLTIDELCKEYGIELNGRENYRI